jgi:hypothetical protein
MSLRSWKLSSKYWLIKELKWSFGAAMVSFFPWAFGILWEQERRFARQKRFQ